MPAALLGELGRLAASGVVQRGVAEALEAERLAGCRRSRRGERAGCPPVAHVIRRHDRARAGGVRAQPEPDRLQREHVLGRDVAEVDVGTEAPHEPHLLVLARSLEQDLLRRDRVRRSRRSGPSAPRRRGGRCRTFPLSRASAITFHAPASSSGWISSTHRYGRHDPRVVLGADLGQHDELLRQSLDQLELVVVRSRSSRRRSRCARARAREARR